MQVLLIFIAICWSSVAIAQEQKVLVVHSYHQGFFWTDSIQRGIAQQVADRSLDMRVLYLDSKRNQSPTFFQQLDSLYRTKLSKERFDAIVVSDNNALALMQRLALVIKDTPVIFSGINNYHASLHQNLNATGVIEDIDLAANLELIERLHPKFQQILIVSDHSVTGAALRAQVADFLEQTPKYRHKVAHLVPDTIDELKQQVSELTQDNVVLFWTYYRDKYRIVSSDRDWREVNQASNAPLFMVHDVGLGHGAVGGVIQSGYRQGFEAAQLLEQVLDNPKAPLPSVIKSESEIKLDYQSVVRWGLGVEQEPTAVFLNKPMPFSQRFAKEIKVFGSVFVLMSIVILLLSYYLQRIRRSEASAREAQTILESVFDQSMQYMGILDQHGLLKSGNDRLQSLLYHQDLRLDRPLWHHKHWSADARQKISEFFQNHHRQVTTFEADIWSKEHGAMVLEVSLKPFSQKVGNENQYLFEARDITSRKLMEDKLYQREASLRNYYEQQPVMMVTLDSNNCIQEVNRFAQQLLGYQPLDMLGHRLREFYSDDKALFPRQVLLQPNHVVHGVWRREIEYVHADGHSVWVRENIRPLRDSDQLLIVGEDISETKKLAKQLEYQARYDLLTDTYNRNHFELELQTALREVESHRRVHAMLYLDLDQLKVLNDTAGHDAGDAAIQFCASMLEEVLPYSAILARMGGDEFAVLLKDCGEHGAIMIAKSIISTLSKQPFIWEDIRLHMSCSVGIRVIDHTAETPQMVHAQADSACHVAKELGRNRYNLFSHDNEEVQQRQREMQSVNLVHDALAGQRLELFAQRILCLQHEDSKMNFEILVRIRNSQGEYISPGIFMPASERYNIAHWIDKQVVNQTLEWFEQRPEKVKNLGRCSINLSGHSMGNQEFIDFLLERLETSSMPCDKICLEITETAAMRNLDQAIAFFTKVKALGCMIALDDFGSGLSSFGYLKKLPVDIVKIDGLFVKDMDKNETDRVMVRSINDLAKQMGKVTVAEFVENSQIIDHLLELGVDYGQGYVIGHPKPLAQLVEELEQERSC
ncbi:ABC transporter substrate binding protein [Vibrio rotiferianus]|uniref:ABC transporter substrate binding protein n=1 Tax=Vibrio rotiferianus TaxID=190895 RepID=UPI00248F4B57|nr:ABC transporter substrate binding protein [Vibrio rotiferianus]